MVAFPSEPNGVKVLVFLDHAITCRHFVLNGALGPLAASADLRFIFPDDGGRRVKLDMAALPLGAPYETLAIDAIRQQTWRWVLYADQLKLRHGAHEGAIRRIRRDTLGWKAAILLTLAGLPVGTWLFRQVVERRFAQHPNRALAAMLDRERPDVVFHPSVLDGVFINDLVIECGAHGIPLVVAMNSWDNPSTKRAVVGWPDYLLVWGSQTRDHALRFMNLPAGRAIEFGAAQFDVFREVPRNDRAAFCAAHGLDPARRIILFAGSNARTDEFGALSTLDVAIESGKLGHVSIVYRPHPWGGGGKDGGRLALASWRHIVVDRTMQGYLDRVAAGDTAMTLPDYRDTHDLLCAVDGVISPVSTILVEAALHGKPVVAYLPETGNETLATMIPLLHFEEFFAIGDVVVARNEDAMLAAVADMVIEGDARGARLKQAMTRFVAPFDKPWRTRIVEFLESVGTDSAVAGSSRYESAAQ
jgi:hypothetical protein